MFFGTAITSSDTKSACVLTTFQAEDADFYL